jgi:hypothetical protein
MRALSAPEILDAWERGLSLARSERVLTLLEAACREPRATLAQLTVGERDARLLQLRDWTFGSRLSSVVMCPACGERLELGFDTADLRVGREEAQPTGTLSLSAAGYALQFRVPNSEDLMAIADCEDARVARQQLLERCVLASEHHGEPVAVSGLPADVVDAVAARMAQADPQGDVQLAVACSHCRHQWQATFDVASFYWSEVHAWAQRTLREVHALASVYGWREADILSMSAWRRQFYLNCIGA